MTDSVPNESGEPKRIGPYKLLEVLGEGGMGEVWLAEQTEPVHRRVALKIIRLGMDTKQVLARLEAERQALAVMDHPNIARFYDGGATETGRPYFVMELVQGPPINDYCDTNRLSTDERIRLFIDVCQAVQHAHHKGVVHRDLKPSNVLVTAKDSKPVVKIIDFGIAKALGQELTDQTLVTRMGQIIGTPEYMSPEQAEMSGLDVDTRTDVYSLGVMLYELLVGARPFDLRARADQAVRYAIRETQIPKPSTRLTSLGETQGTIAKHRRTTVEALRKELKSDLDWIILKAMEKDRTRRYETANGFLQDLERHLRHEPVLARGPSARYRLQKYVKRHRVGVAATAAVVLALVAGFSLATVGMLRAQRAERWAEQEAEAARQVSDFLVELFEVSDPSEARGNTITAREILDRGSERIEDELTEEPLLKAQMMGTIGKVYMGLGLYGEAMTYLEQALSIREQILDPSDPSIAQSLGSLGSLLRMRGEWDEAERLHLRALEIKRTAFGADHHEYASSLLNLGNVLHQRGEYEEALEHYQVAVGILETSPEPLDTLLAAGLNNVASTLKSTGKYEEALAPLERCLAIREAALPPDHPDLAMTLLNLGDLHYFLGDLDEASLFWERSVPIAERVYGPNHPNLALALERLGALYRGRGDFPKAKPYFEQVVAIREKALGPAHPLLGGSISNLGVLEADMGNLQEAARLIRRGLEIKEQNLGSAHPDVAKETNNLASTYIDMGDLVTARPLLDRALGIAESAFGGKHPLVASVLTNYAVLLYQTGELAETEAITRRILEILEEVLGPGAPDLASVLDRLATVMMEQGKYQDVEPHLQRALEIREASVGRDDPSITPTLELYAELLRNLGREGEAEELEARARAIREGSG